MGGRGEGWAGRLCRRLRLRNKPPQTPCVRPVCGPVVSWADWGAPQGLVGLSRGNQGSLQPLAHHHGEADEPQGGDTQGFGQLRLRTKGRGVASAGQLVTDSEGHSGRRDRGSGRRPQGRGRSEPRSAGWRQWHSGFFFYFFWLEMTFLRCRSNSMCGGRFINCCFEGLRSRSVLVVYLRFCMGGYFCFLVDKNVLPIPLSTEVAKS